LSVGGAFGWFVNVHPDFTLMSVTQNQYSAYTTLENTMSCSGNDQCCGNGGGTIDLKSCIQTAIVLVGINQTDKQFELDETPRFYQDGSKILNNGGSVLPDPLFGAIVNFSNASNSNSIITTSIITSSPRNSQVLWYKYFLK
jgi:hypothetical protein